MSSNDSGKTAPVDYVAMAVAPVLIMAQVGSLVFFLLEILYAGNYTGELKWMLFFFVFGAVLICRISMQGDIARRAGLYGAIMGLLVWIGLLKYVEFPKESTAAQLAWLINLGLIALIWWSAYQLTWDCTFLDDRLGNTGRGVLQAAGLEEKPAEDEEDDRPPGEEAKPEPTDWIERYKRYREERDRKRTPGVWVVYFALAALPIFGLGQALIPAEESGRRTYTFWLMAIYTASGLGLLLTTSFLGLRMYLRRRRLKMPPAMTTAWLSAGGLLIALLLVAGAVLPRPASETRVFDIDPVGSEKRQASRHNVRDGTGGEGEGRGQGKPQPGHKDKGQDGGGDQGKDRAPGGQKDKGQGGDSKDKGSSGKDSQKDGTGGGQKDKQANGQKDRQAGNNANQKKDDKEQAGSSGGGKKDKDDKQNEGNNQGGRDGQNNSPGSEKSSGSTSKLGSILKWIVLIVLGLVIAFYVIRSFLQWFANFTDWAKNLLDAWRRFWESLWALFAGKKAEEKTETAEEIEEADPVVTQPFSDFGNPFADGRADRLSPQELARYCFAALQAWARERDLARRPGETPLEFADRLGAELPPLDEAAQRLASLYARAVYGRGGMPATTRETLEEFWETLSRTTEQPLSA